MISKVSTYADQKIANLKVLLNGENSGLTTTNARINELQDAIQKQGGLSSVERLLLVNQLGFAEQQLQQLQQQQSNTRLQLTLAQQVEKARVVTRAAAVKSTAKSHRNSALVGALHRPAARDRRRAAVGSGRRAHESPGARLTPLPCWTASASGS